MLPLLVVMLGHCHAGKTAPGLGKLPGEAGYISDVLPDDLSWSAQIGDVTSMHRVISFGAYNAPCFASPSAALIASS